MEVIISYGKIRIVAFENGYSVTHRNRVVSDRQLALYFKMPKEKLQELTVKHHAKIKEEDTREISCFSDLIDALEFVKEITTV